MATITVSVISSIVTAHSSPQTEVDFEAEILERSRSLAAVANAVNQYGLLHLEPEGTGRSGSKKPIRSWSKGVRVVELKQQQPPSFPRQDTLFAVCRA